eukprot:scaffold950_cov360-Pavlova_lutheri.AAC.45
MALDPKVATPPSGVWYPGKHPLASYACGLPVFRLDHGYEELAFDVPVHNYLVSSTVCEAGLALVPLRSDKSFSYGRFQVGLDLSMSKRNDSHFFILHIHVNAVHELFLDKVLNFLFLATLEPEDIFQSVGNPRHDFPGPLELFQLLLVPYLHDPGGTRHDDRRAQDQDAPFVRLDTVPFPSEELSCGRARPDVGRQGDSEEEIHRATHHHAHQARVLRLSRHGEATRRARASSGFVPNCASYVG